MTSFLNPHLALAESFAEGQVTTDVLSNLSDWFDVEQRIELLMTAGFYCMVTKGDPGSQSIARERPTQLMATCRQSRWRRGPMLGMVRMPEQPPQRGRSRSFDAVGGDVRGGLDWVSK